MTHAYAEGLHGALMLLAWTAGVLTVLLCVATLLGLLLLAGTRLDQYRPTFKTWRARRTHARSGRLTGPR